MNIMPVQNQCYCNPMYPVPIPVVPVQVPYCPQQYTQFVPETQSPIIQKYYPTIQRDNSGLYTINDVLYDKKNISELLRMNGNPQMNAMYEQIKDNKDFQELTNSKYFAKANGFLVLLDTITHLKNQRDIKTAPPPFGVLIDYFYERPEYGKYDVPDYLRILNNFTKTNKVSDDLKQYYIIKESQNIDNYYTKLDKIDTSASAVTALL